MQHKGRDSFRKGHVYIELGRVESWEDEVHSVVKRYLTQECQPVVPYQLLQLLHVTTTDISLLLEGMILGGLSAILGEGEIASFEIKAVRAVKDSTKVKNQEFQKAKNEGEESG